MKLSNNILMFHNSNCKSDIFNLLIHACMVLNFKFACSPNDDGGFFICGGKAEFLMAIRANMPIVEEQMDCLCNFVNENCKEVCGEMSLSYVATKKVI